MPEGDSIRRAAERVGSALLDRPLTEVQVPNPRAAHLRSAERLLAGRRLTSTEPVGKYLTLHFGDDLAIRSHLRMNGRWHVYPRGSAWRRSPTGAWLILGTDQMQVVQFGGPVLELVRGGHARRDRRVGALGPDILDREFDRARAIRGLRSRGPERTLGDALLDQRAVAGIGNLFKSEGCFAARVSPWVPIGGLDDEALGHVLARIRALIRRGAGITGRAPRRIYRRARKPCPTCGGLVRSRGQGDDNRTTYWCETCQPGPAPPRHPTRPASAGPYPVADG
ncbi:MAG: DNA-formamidopyrimidine glycosylase family protein [Solirubrobacterales bacterium]